MPWMRVVRLGVLLGLLSGSSACVGPNKLKRAFDVRANESYVESPIWHQIKFPYSFVMNHLAALGDLLISNPYYWWRDVWRGEGGTPFVYRNVDDAPEEAASGPAAE